MRTIFKNIAASNILWYIITYRLIDGDGVHQNRVMLMTPIGNNIIIPVGVF